MTVTQSFEIYNILRKRAKNDAEAKWLTKKVVNILNSDDIEFQIAKQKRIGKIIRVAIISVLSISFLSFVFYKIFK